MNDQVLRAAIDALYAVFSSYGPGNDFCGFCYSQDEVERITRTPVSELPVELSRKLLWETGNHWQNSEVYRHYLPRMLEILAPPISEEDLYPAHLFETMDYLDIKSWPEYERLAIRDFLLAITPLLQFDEEDRREWAEGLKSVGYT